MLSSVESASAKESKPKTIPAPVQDATLDSFLSRLSYKKLNNLSHEETVDSYFSFWNDKQQNLSSQEEKDAKERDEVLLRKEKSDQLTNHYYDLVTDFYEYGWGSSFHFAPMYKDSTFAQSIARHEDFLAVKLRLEPHEKCLDVGCGVGGPMREIAKFSGASIVGLNNNEYQVKRCGYLARKTGLDTLCSAVKGDFEDMPFVEGTFDKAYAIEATCHSRDLANVYGQVFQALKPGGLFACYEWLVTPNYDATNPVHKQIIYNLEQGNSLPELNTYQDCLDALKSVGFEIVEYVDLADPETQIAPRAQDPWYLPLKGTYELSLDSISRWKMTPIGRFITDTFVTVLESTGLAPSGTRKISKVLNDGADALVAAARKPLVQDLDMRTRDDGQLVNELDPDLDDDYDEEGEDFDQDEQV